MNESGNMSLTEEERKKAQTLIPYYQEFMQYVTDLDNPENVKRLKPVLYNFMAKAYELSGRPLSVDGTGQKKEHEEKNQSSEYSEAGSTIKSAERGQLHDSS